MALKTINQTFVGIYGWAEWAFNGESSLNWKQSFDLREVINYQPD